MLNLICGSAGSGKSRQIYNKISALSKEGKKSLLIVPESMSHLAERRLLLSCGNSVSRYAKVTTLSHLTSDIFFTCGLTDKYLDNGGRVLSMYRAISQLEGSLRYYGSEVFRPALVSSMLDITNELIHSGISDSELSKVSSSLSEKMQDISLIYTSYLSVCRESSLDPAVAMDKAAEHIAQSEIFSDTYVFFDDFTAYSEQKMRFIEHILAESKEVTFAVLTNGDPVVFHEQHRLLRRLEGMVTRKGEKPNRTDLPLPRGIKAPELEALENLFVPSPPKYEGETNAVELFSARDMAEECELAAAKIRWLTLKQGARLRDIAVVCGNESDYAPLLESAFTRYGIPFFFSRREDVLKKPAYAAALGALSCLCDGLRLETVLSYLKCGLLGLSDDSLCKLENYALMWGISGKAWFEPFTKSTNGFGDLRFNNGALLAEIENARQTAVANISLLKQLTGDCKYGKDYIAAFSEYLKQTNLRRLFEERMAVLNNAERYQDAAEYAQLYEILTGALTQLEAVCGDLAMDIRDFRELLTLTLSQYDVSSIPTSLDSVTVGTFARLASFGIKHLIVLGARYGALPPDTPSGSILSENERDELEKHSINLPRSEDKSLSMQADVYRAFNAPEKSLTVLRPTSGIGDDTFIKSQIVSYMENILPKLKEQKASDALAYLRLTAEKPAFELACTATETAAMQEITPESVAARSRLCKAEDNIQRFKHLEKYAQNPREVISNPEIIKKLYKGEINVSASAVDKFYDCRFLHFCQYGLRAEERKVAEYGALEIGTYIHEVVENAVRDLATGEESNPASAAYKRADEAIASRKDADTPRIQALLAQFKENAAFIIRDVWEEINSSSFKPAYFEFDVGFGRDAEPTVWQEGDFKVILKGKIDRVDRFGDLLKIVDYKTGTKEYSAGDILYGKNLQPFIYMLMLKNAGLGEGCAALYIPAVSSYLNVPAPQTDEEAKHLRGLIVRRKGLVRSDADILEALETGCTSSKSRWLPLLYEKNGALNINSSNVASKEQMDKIVGYTERKLKEYAKGVASGDISIAPLGPNACRWCKYKTVCVSAIEGEEYRPHLKTAELVKMIDEEESRNEQA